MACWKPKTDHVEIEPPADIEALFRDPIYSDNNGLMSLIQFRTFLREFQREDDAIIDVVIQGLDHRRITQQKGLRLDDFFTYLFGDLNLPIPQQVHQDMDAPLAHYFLHTRVKVRLFSPLKGQLKSSKTKRNISAIKEALHMGVRVFQLDLSYTPKKNGAINNSSPENLDVRGTLKHYMEAFRDHAFPIHDVHLHYPVILAFEGDFDSKIQSHVDEMVQTIFAGMLHDPKMEPQTHYSPKNLMKKILLAQPSRESYEMKKENTQKMKLEDVKLKRSLSETLATKYDNISYFRMTQPKLENVVKTHGDQIVEFTQENLLTVYPVDKLSGSKNCNPLTGWSHGAQMVAANGQGHDKYLDVMQGMFRGNGGCGYFKKPDILLKGDVNNKIFDPKITLKVKTTLKVKIYMGDGWHLDFSYMKFDLLSPPDFFLKVQVFGVTADHAKEETEQKQDKWRPNWNQEFKFELTVPELALLRIEARDLDNDMGHDFGGETCLPVRELKTGIRTVPLYDKRGRMYKNVRLLVGFDFIDHN